MFFFHLRRYDGVLERDAIGLEMAEHDLLRESDAGARGLVIESLSERTDCFYWRFEIADAHGRTVSIFDFASVFEKIQCARGVMSVGGWPDEPYDREPPGPTRSQVRLPDNTSRQTVRSS